MSHSAAAATGPGAKVSFTFDDGFTSSLLAAETLKTYGFSGTNYVVPHCVGFTAGSPDNDCEADSTTSYMTWSQLATLQNTYGWEIGSHTMTHPLTADNPSLTDAMLDAEMADSQQAIQSHGLLGVNFASPYGDYNDRSVAVAAKYYASHRTFHDLTYSTDIETNTFPYYSPRSSYPFNNYLLTVLPVQGDVSPATVNAYIDQAKANGQWLILVFHEIKADGDPSYDPSLDAYQYRTGDLGAIAAHAKSIDIPVVTVNDALPSGTDIMPNSDFNNGIADGWTTDSALITADQQPTTFAGHGSYDGTTLGPRNSIKLLGSSANTHLFSPQIEVSPTLTYTVKNFVNITSDKVGAIDFYINEYNADGNEIGGRYIPGIQGTTDPDDAQVGNVNFLYSASSSDVKYARLQVIVTGVNTVAYVDNLQWLSPVPPTPPLQAGDVNGDGTIDALDLSTVLSNWNQSGRTRAQGDLNTDGTVDALDLSIVLSNWSQES